MRHVFRHAMHAGGLVSGKVSKQVTIYLPFELLEYMGRYPQKNERKETAL